MAFQSDADFGNGDDTMDFAPGPRSSSLSKRGVIAAVLEIMIAVAASLTATALIARRLTTSSPSEDASALVSDGTPLRICVFGSSSGATPEAYLAVARELGRLCAISNHICVTGAGKTGCMGALNTGALSAGGRVEGVIHKMWMTGAPEDDQQTDLSSLLVADGPTLAERKDMLCRPSDAFIVLPGGAGTLDEAWEMVAEQQLRLPRGSVARPVCFLNIQGYYDGTIEQVRDFFSIQYTSMTEYFVNINILFNAIIIFQASPCSRGRHFVC